jgi:hypothetical protein
MLGRLPAIKLRHRKERIEISSISHEVIGGTHCLRADVNGSDLWFKSKRQLRPSAEAFASAMLVPALHMGADIFMEDPLTPSWMSNTGRLMSIFGGWMKRPAINIHSRLAEREASWSGEKTAIFFSGGLDSFFTVLRGPFVKDMLVLLQGFDFTLQDEDGLKTSEETLGLVCKTVGAEPVVIKTNMREHPVFNRASWELTHGGALASCGYALKDVGRLVISSSYHYSQDFPWGSHWRTDPLWSSKGFEVVHWDASYKRPEKLKAIVDEPLLKEHLRVCWDRGSARLNCSRCEKCVRTMVTLEALGKLSEYRGFDLDRPISEVLDDIPYLKGKASYFFQNILATYPDFKLSGNIRALIERSRKHYKNKKGLPRLLAKIDREIISRIRAGFGLL